MKLQKLNLQLLIKAPCHLRHLKSVALKLVMICANQVAHLEKSLIKTDGRTPTKSEQKA